MANAMFELYANSVMDLTRTLVVKFTPTATAINRGLEELGYAVDPYDRTSWKYYLNLAGEYHESNREMYVVSLDRPEEGEQLFTKDMLNNNKLTRDLYRYGSRYYNELVRRYPSQQDLINGILNPIDITTAINAEDGDILFYDQSLVEFNEENLIPELQAWIKRLYARWFVPDYAIVENLYWPQILATIYAYMPSRIMSQRLENCKTPYAHSHHIRQYLESNGRLGEFIPYMTKEQMLWLYRNIQFLRTYAGHTSTFETLVQKILTDRGLPLSEYELEHNIASFDDDKFPDVQMIRQPVSFTQEGTGSDIRSTLSILRKESELTPMSESEILYQNNRVHELTGRGGANVLPTKVLESAVVDRTDAVAFPLADVLFYHWQYWAATDSFRARMSVTMPQTGDPLILDAKEAFVLYAYAVGAAYDEAPPEVVPAAAVRNVRRDQDPTFEQLKAVVDERIVHDDVIEYAQQTDYSFNIVYDTDTFYQTCALIQKELMRHYTLYATREHLDEHAQVAKMVSLYYFDQNVDFEETGETYSSWLQRKGIILDGMTRQDYETLCLNLVSKATGAGENTSKTLRETHAAMVRLLTRLSSYSIQILRSINNSKETVLDTPALRWGETNFAERAGQETARIPDVTVIDWRSAILSSDETSGYPSLRNGVEPIEQDTFKQQTVDVLSGLVVEVDQVRLSHADVPIPAIDVLQDWDESLDLGTLSNDNIDEYLYPDDTP